MHPARRTAPADRTTPAGRTAPAGRAAAPPAPGHRLAATLAALLAVLLVLVPAWPVAGAGTTVPGPVPAPAATAVPHPDAGYHADDNCATGCAAQVRPRHDHLAERPAPPDRLATVTRAAGTAPAAHRRTSAAPRPVPVSPGRASHDRGRAPPVSSGN